MKTADGDEYLEIEVKFLLSDLEKFRDRLLERGARLVAPRFLEQNILFDNSWQGLARQGKLLRLRQDVGALITFKGPSARQAGSEARVREEIEVAVDDFKKTQAILERLGFEKRLLYEKYRESYSFGGIDAVLDELPFGSFIELEGAEQDIRTAAGLLGLAWDRRIIDNYLSLFLRLKAYYSLPFDDITFANFASCEIPDAAAIVEGRLAS